MPKHECRMNDEALMTNGRWQLAISLPLLAPKRRGLAPRTHGACTRNFRALRHSIFVILSTLVIGPSSFLARFLVRGVLPLLAAEFLQLEPLGPAGFLLGPVVPAAADGALQPDIFTHTSRPIRK